MNDDTQIGALSGKVDQFQKDLLAHQIADEKAHSAIEKSIVVLETGMQGVNARLDAHSKSLESMSAGVVDIKTAIHGLDSIADGFLREYKKVNTLVADVKRIDAKIAYIEKDVAANKEDREHSQERCKVIRDRVQRFVVPAVLVGVIYLMVVEFRIVKLPKAEAVAESN